MIQLEYQILHDIGNYLRARVCVCAYMLLYIYIYTALQTLRLRLRSTWTCVRTSPGQNPRWHCCLRASCPKWLESQPQSNHFLVPNYPLLDYPPASVSLKPKYNVRGQVGFLRLLGGQGSYNQTLTVLVIATWLNLLKGVIGGLYLRLWPRCNFPGPPSRQRLPKKQGCSHGTCPWSLTGCPTPKSAFARFVIRSGNCWYKAARKDRKRERARENM